MKTLTLSRSRFTRLEIALPPPLASPCFSRLPYPMLFRTFFAIDIVASAVIVYFFFVGLADGSVSSFNAGLWAAILLATAAVLLGGWRLGVSGRRGAATALLAIPALPALAFGLFLLLLMITQPNWH